MIKISSNVRLREWAHREVDGAFLREEANLVSQFVVFLLRLIKLDPHFLQLRLHPVVLLCDKIY